MLQTVEQEIKKSMIAKEAKRLSVLRMVKADILNNDKSAKPKEHTAVVNDYLKKLLKTKEMNDSVGVDPADLLAEISVVKELLPPEISEEVLEAAVVEAMKTESNVGLLMKGLKTQFPTADGKLLNQLIAKNKQ